MKALFWLLIWVAGLYLGMHWLMQGGFYIPHLHFAGM